MDLLPKIDTDNFVFSVYSFYIDVFDPNKAADAKKLPFAPDQMKLQMPVSAKSYISYWKSFSDLSKR